MKYRIEANALEKIWLWVQLAPGEIQGFGRVVLDPDGTPRVTDVFILKQTCTGVSASMDEEAIALMLNNAILQNIPPEELRFWWHSHADMDTFWSGTDTGTIEHMLNESFLLSLVVNKKRGMKSRIDILNPLRISLDATHEIVLTLSTEDEKRCKEEFGNLVTTQTYAQMGVYNYGSKFSSSGGHSQYGDSQWDSRGSNWDGEYRLFHGAGSGEDGGREYESVGSGRGVRTQSTKSMVQVVGRGSKKSRQLGRNIRRVRRTKAESTGEGVSRTGGRWDNDSMRGFYGRPFEDMEDD